jgi:hypothetical protein
MARLLPLRSQKQLLSAFSPPRGLRSWTNFARFSQQRLIRPKPEAPWGRRQQRQSTGKSIHYSITRQDFAGADLSLRRSMASFGTMRPKLIAIVMVAAVKPSAIVAFRSSNVVCEPSASCRRPLAALKR